MVRTSFLRVFQLVFTLTFFNLGVMRVEQDLTDFVQKRFSRREQPKISSEEKARILGEVLRGKKERNDR